MCIRDRLCFAPLLLDGRRRLDFRRWYADDGRRDGGQVAIERGGVRGNPCLLYTSDAADERSSVDLGGRRIIKKKNDRKKGCEGPIIEQRSNKEDE